MVVIDAGDIGKSREEVLLDLIYESTGERLPLDKVTIGKPREVDKRKDLNLDPNTFIPVKVNPSYDSRYSANGSGFLYRRRDIAIYVEDCDFGLVSPMGFPFNTTDLLEQINLLLEYPIFADDIVDHKYSTIAQVNRGIRLKMHPHALLWTGEVTIYVNTHYLEGGLLVQFTELNGFTEWAEAA